MIYPAQTLPDLFNNLPDEVKQWLSQILDENPKLLIEYMGISNNDIIREFVREKNKDTETKNKELRIKEANYFKEDVIRKTNELISQLAKERGFTQEDFEVEFNLKFKDKILRSVQNDKDNNNDRKDQNTSIPIIDLDSDPFIPNGLKLESHQKHGQFKWDPKKIKLYLSDNQRNDKTIRGHNLRKELEKQKVLNANLLDFLLKNPRLIPKNWKVGENGKTRYIFFWGTIYRDSSDSLYVRCLLWNVGEWRWSYDLLVLVWGADDPSAVLTSE